MVLDDERLGEPGVQLLPDDARRRVDPAARRDVDDDPHWPGRIGGVLGGRRRGDEERGCKGCGEGEDLGHVVLVFPYDVIFLRPRYFARFARLRRKVAISAWCGSKSASPHSRIDSCWASRG